MHKLSQAGFAAMQLVLIVVVLVVAAATGYFVYTANNSVTDTLDAGSQSTAAPVSTSTTESDEADTTVPELETSDEALQQSANEANPVDDASNSEFAETNQVIAEEE